MEKSADELGGIPQQGLSIRPPNLEDAGLEDCALPPDSIMEAFARAASSLKSCVQDPGPTNGEMPGSLPGIGDGGGAPACGDGSVAGRAAEGVEGDGVVAVGGGEVRGDRVLVLGGDEEGKGRACCDQDGDGDVGEKEGGVADDGCGDDDDDKPILVEVLI